MRSNDELLTDIALSVARRSPLKKYQTGAILVRNGIVVSNGWSHVGLRLTACYGVHAEIHALMRARHLDLEGATCYVGTYRSRSQRIVTSKPCRTCALALLKAGVSFITYVCEGAAPESIDLNNLPIDLKRYAKPYATNS